MNRVRTRIALVLGALVLGAGLASVAPAAAEAPPPAPAPAVRELEIVVDGGYVPNRVTITEGEAVRLKFIRRDYSPCAREVVFASLGIRRELPIDIPVFIDIPAQPPGDVEFKCGMSMLRGVIVVEPRK
jgi:plastocyanin domain-containing protein